MAFRVKTIAKAKRGLEKTQQLLMAEQRFDVSATPEPMQNPPILLFDAIEEDALTCRKAPDARAQIVIAAASDVRDQKSRLVEVCGFPPFSQINCEIDGAPGEQDVVA